MRFDRHTLTRREFATMLAVASLAFAAQPSRPLYSIGGVGIGLERYSDEDVRNVRAFLREAAR